MGGCASKEAEAAVPGAGRVVVQAAAPAPSVAAGADGTAAAAAAAPPAQPPANGGAEAAWAYKGAPRPANETERLELLHALGVLDSEQGPDQFDAITRLLCAVFGVPVALVSLVDAERQWFKSVQGLGDCIQQTGRTESFCAWTLLPESPQVLIVEDALQDKRFAENPLVTGGPGIRFYAGAPLISSANGYRYGSLCVIDTKPHHNFAAEQYNMLVQFAELCVREIEKDKLTTLQKMVQQAGSLRSEASMSPVSSLRTSAAPSMTPSLPPTVPELHQFRPQQAQQQQQQQQGASGSGSGSGGGTSVGDPSGAFWGLTRAVDCFREGVMLVDVSTPAWQLQYTNDAFTVASGVPRDEATAQGFWEIFSSPGLGPATYQDAVEAGEPFVVAVSLQPIYSRSPRPIMVDFRPAATGQVGGHSQLIGIPAEIASTTIAQQLQQQIAAAQAPAQTFYFGILRTETRRTSRTISADGSVAAAMAAAAAADTGRRRSSLGQAGATSDAADAGSTYDCLLPLPSGAVSPARVTTTAAAALQSRGPSHPQPQESRASMDSDRSHSHLSFKRAMPSAFTDVRLGPLIGRGAYGRVYRGSWNGTTVAVKVIETTEPLDEAGLAPGKNGIFEAVLSSNLSHPNIVHTYQYAFRPVTADEREDRGSGGNSLAGSSSDDRGAANKAATEVWLVSEFCNRSPLLTAIERGAFLTQPSSQYGQPNLISVLQTLQEIAAALQYLHRNDVLHGDLTGGNVLLTASDKDTRGFTAKVVDFGLSRVCSGDYLRTRTLGCAEYMPPELITEGILTKAADVYAFGVITWEIYVGRRAWEGLKPTEVLRKVASNTPLEFPTQTPHRLKVLGERCMEYAPAARPTMEEVLSEVNSILSDTMGILQQFLAASTAAAVNNGGGGGGGGRGSPSGGNAFPAQQQQQQQHPADPFQ